MGKSNQHNLFRIVLSLVFIFFGIIALGNNIGWWYIDDLFMQWWPIILILLGFVTLFAPGGSWGGGVFMILLGVILLLHTHGIYDIGQLIWPAMLILFGFIVWPRKKNPAKPDSPNNAEELNSEDHVFNFNSIFQGQQKSISDKQLNGGHASVVFGNLDLDLRNAVPNTGAYIELSAVFGKLSIALPSNWNISREGGAVFGKISDRRKNVPDAALSYSVTLDLNAVFGEIEISN
ncbi:MAG: DUF5668 domain-containing protein [Candidatus Marinimicrobia bacterium]|jgi:predicted membrane protein|nr:DUF5668 domain-containing protein [Candidatus Neomarinimicrobiota bacterium]MDD4960628.1 DUF5668 domain-containing protein [Candidatus Neomarinimicrobiota bacterium]MDD5709590.1 DUF5668 domain-containing protein [Candidatus Neomarinimicrobiota bacterium]MDX9777299.1 DUF5668 domain-containing protein [bacterium]